MGDAGSVTDQPAAPTYARRERELLCSLFLDVGPSAPTLCEGWLTLDLLAHLVLRESHPAALGSVVAPLKRWQTHVQENLKRQPFRELVDRLRAGPGRHSLLRPEKVDTVFNTFEFFVHHEDVRRAQPRWEPRVLAEKDQTLLWRVLVARGKHFVRHSPVGVTLSNSAEDNSAGKEATIRSGDPAVTLTGDPGELVLYLHGRKDQAKVALSGDVDAVEQFVARD